MPYVFHSTPIHLLTCTSSLSSTAGSEVLANAIASDNTLLISLYRIRHTRSTAATMSALANMSAMPPMPPMPPSLLASEQTSEMSDPDLKTTSASPKNAINGIPEYSGEHDRASDNGDDVGEHGTAAWEESMNKTGKRGIGFGAMGTSAVNADRRAASKYKNQGVLKGLSMYDEDSDEDLEYRLDGNDGDDLEQGNDEIEDQLYRGSTGTTPVVAKKTTMNKRNSAGVVDELPEYDQDYGDTSDDIEGEFEDNGGSADHTPVLGAKVNGKRKGKEKATDKRKFGGSSKGRKCFRWTPKQEKAAIRGMLQIRAEGEILGDACFEELYKRLLARDPTWNHSVSGIHNAWHRRNLVAAVQRSEAMARREQEELQKKIDKELGLAFKPKRPAKRKTTTKKSQHLTKHECDTNSLNEDDEETDDALMFVSNRKRPRLGSFTPLTQPNLASLDAASPRNLPATNVFASPATMAASQRVFDFPTVTVSFKHRKNGSRRTRDFTHVDTMNRFWNQVVATPMFNNLREDFMVVAFWFGESERRYTMAMHDELDYAYFVRLVKRAVDAAGEEPIVVHVTAAVS